MIAQDLFKSFLRDFMAPALRDHGFKGGGQNYELPRPEVWVLLGFQKSRFSDSSSVSFTVNLTDVAKVAWEDARARFSHYPVRPAPSTFYGSCAGQDRIGMLTDEKQDLWWTLDQATSQDALAVEVLGVIQSRAIPALHEQVKRLVGGAGNATTAPEVDGP